MKNAILLISAFLLVVGLYAQEIPFEDLPEIVRQDMLIEEEDFQDMQLPDSCVINSESGYYKGSRRTESTDTLIYYKWHRVDEVWIPVHRLIKTYDGEENVISSLLQHLRPQGDEWVNGVLKSYTYDGGLLVNVVIQYWNHHIDDWFNHFQKNFSYYDDGLLAEITHQVWKFQEEEWADRYRKVFVYNEDGSLSSDTVYNSRPSQQEWIYKQLDEYYYNDAGFRTEHLTSHFVPDSAIWKNIHRELFNPDDAGMVQDITVQHWCRMMQAWKNVKWILFTYNENDLVTERLVKYWHRFDSVWVDAHRNLFTYDANDNLDTMIFQRWREGAEVWVNKELNDFEYDAAGTLLSRLTQLWNPWEQVWHNFRLMELVIDLKHLVAGTGEPGQENQSGISVSFPNPYNSSNPITVIGIEGVNYNVKVSDLNGQIVFARQVASGRQFRIDDELTPGLYILMVSDQQNILKSSKILITR